ncbi:MAG: hypothetical protein U5K37_00035 [Natrialbaceae archaeon]|nr:hypothetical protein [Natrialbaceae archaeon]
MSLWCSVLGHDYGQSVVENEHERRGDSMVFSVLEYEECTRCGERNVISKNKRTTRIDEDPDPDASDAEPEPESTASTPDDRGVTVVDDGQSGGDEPAQSSPSRQPPQPSAPAESPDSTPAEESTEASDEFDSGPADAESGTHADEGVEVLDGESSVEEPTETPSPPPGEPVDEPAASRDHPGEKGDTHDVDSTKSEPAGRPPGQSPTSRRPHRMARPMAR